MSYNLVIDQGNSRAKVALFRENEFVEEWRYDLLTPDLLLDLAGRYPVDSAIYSSVATEGGDIIVTLRSIARKVYELTSLLPLPVRIGYSTPSTLGRDRVAAVAGAAALYPGENVLVVDAGTAVTYEFLSSDRLYVGGNIAPGLWMRAESLHAMTRRLPQVDVETPGEIPLWGDSTDSAIRAGVRHGVAAEIEYYRARCPRDTRVVLTGGDAPLIAPLLGPDITVEPLLVCKGLNSILLYNEYL